jgi:hypothetical protein
MFKPILAITLSFLFFACDPAPIQPGAINAQWTLSPLTCDALHLDTITTRAFTGGEMVKEMSVPCADSGVILLSELPPAVYRLEINGLNTEEPPRATHGASQDTVNVLEGITTESGEMRLVEKYGRIHVRWIFDSGLQCIDNDVATVTVELLDGKNRNVGKEDSVACDTVFTDLETGKTNSGLLFSDLTAEEGLTLLIQGYNADGEKVLEGQEKNFLLLPGETKILTLTLCEESPCS